MAQILHDLQPNSEKPHAFPEATYNVAVRNTCGFSVFIFAEGRYLWPFIHSRFHYNFYLSHSCPDNSLFADLESIIRISDL